MVTLCRMQVTTSCRMRRAGSWNSTSLVTTVAHPEALRQVVQFVNPHLVVRTPAQRQRHVGPVAEGVPQLAKPQRAGVVGRVRNEHRDQALRPVDQDRPS